MTFNVRARVQSRLQPSGYLRWRARREGNEIERQRVEETQPYRALENHRKVREFRANDVTTASWRFQALN